PATPAEARAPAPADPRGIYLRDCAVCHGSDGAGTPRGPSLLGLGRASVDYWVSTGRMPLTTPVRHDPLPPYRELPPPLRGFDPAAPPARHKPAYPPETIGALVDYVVSLGPGGPDIPAVDVATGDVARGGEIFRLQCAACHAWAGDGGALLHREAPSLHDATPTQIAEAIRVGPGNMPAFGPAAVDNTDLDALVAYVRYLDRPRDRGGNPLWHLGPVAEGLIAWVLAMGSITLAVRWMGERASA
ncbi:MAG: cytochrome c class, partial [Acidimicrobiales bacterium]|nr:cytochrome c class [Acidimicrobiales bacterium]